MSLREAAQQALEALSAGGLSAHATKKAREAAIIQLRNALADATSQESRQVEPVGYFSINSYGNWEQNESGYGTPLYEAPPKREPLTDEEIRLIDSGTNFHEASDWSLRFARAIERAHGIGGEE